MHTEKKTIIFDGVCNLCNNTIQFIIKRDNDDVFRYTALQSNTGKKLTAERNIDTKKVDSIIVIDPGIAYYTKSDAVLQIGMHLKGYRTVAKVFKLIPSNLLNIIYDFVARNRYKWYGKKRECMVPTPELKAKFLD